MAGRIRQRSRHLLEAIQPEAIVTAAARRWGIGTGLIYIWRKHTQNAELDPLPTRAAASTPGAHMDACLNV